MARNIWVVKVVLLLGVVMLLGYAFQETEKFELRDAASILAVIVSSSAAMFTHRTWLETYRPIVTVGVVTYEAGSDGIAYNLVVYNVGNRPAVNICLQASRADVEKLLAPTATGKLRFDVERCFAEELKIPLLHPGCSVENAFGSTSRIAEQNSLNYGSSASVTVTYNDLNRRTFTSHLQIVVQDSAYFAGSGWGRRNE